MSRGVPERIGLGAPATMTQRKRAETLSRTVAAASSTALATSIAPSLAFHAVTGMQGARSSDGRDSETVAIVRFAAQKALGSQAP
jgi:hypothetical protein